MIEKNRKIWMVASGDLRESANTDCWPSQHKMEQQIVEAFRKKGYTVERAHSYDKELGHGFINSQKMGLEVFRKIPDRKSVV